MRQHTSPHLEGVVGGEEELGLVGLDVDILRDVAHMAAAPDRVELHLPQHAILCQPVTASHSIDECHCALFVERCGEDLRHSVAPARHEKSRVAAVPLKSRPRQHVWASVDLSRGHSASGPSG